MLKELVISNFAIIDRLELGLGAGLICLTGETGAGKSIMVDAISALLGGKTGPEYLREGREAVIEAAFDIAGLSGLADRLRELGLEPDDELIIRRVISAGRSKVYINGSLASISNLQEIGNYLVDLHGQHEHQSLLKVDTHIELLDAYCGLTDKTAGYAAEYRNSRETAKRLEGMKAMERENARRLDLLRFQKDEIDAAEPVVGEEEELGEERSRLMHSDRLRELCLQSLGALSSDEISAFALVADAQKCVKEITALVMGQDECMGLVDSALVSIEEACQRIRALEGSLESDPERLEEIESRLDVLARLRRKYGETVAEILAFREDVADELARLENASDEAAGLEKALAESESRIIRLGAELSRARLDGAKEFASRVAAELAGLAMGKARFDVAFSPLPTPGPRGAEKAEFIFSANAGEDLRPLMKIASGGELSRVMLALKIVLSRVDSVPTLIFDEVDSGVGGQAAGALGVKLREASAGRQVLCITHLPQVAAMAQEHYTVAKVSDGEHTGVMVRRLSRDERVVELARMLGGEGMTTASAHAEEILRQGEVFVLS